jgi:hypothetical protein
MLEPSTAIADSVIVSRKLPPEAKALYCVLRQRSRATGRCRLTQSDLAMAAGIRTVKTLRRHLAILSALGLVRVTRRGEYVVSDPAAVSAAASLPTVQKRLQDAHFRGEALMREWLNLLVARDDFQDGARPGFLVNPTTAERMEYDRWYPPDAAFEFNGFQHSGPTERYPSEAEAHERRARDLIKLGLSTEREVALVIIRGEDLSYGAMVAKINSRARLPLRPDTAHSAVAGFLEKQSVRYRNWIHSRETVGVADPARQVRLLAPATRTSPPPATRPATTRSPSPSPAGASQTIP